MIGALQQAEIVENERKTPIILETTVNIDSYTEFEYLQKFRDLKNKGIIINCEFSDNIWNVRDKLKDVVHHPNFTGAYDNKSIKYYAVLMLEELSPATASRGITMINQLIMDTEFFTSEWITYNAFYKVTPYNVSVIQGFLDFIKISKAEARQYVEVLKEKCDYSSQTRELPTMDSLIKFNTLMEDFIAMHINKYKEFLPVAIWWKLTMTIPMRPVEFSTLKKDSIWREGGRYYIKILRAEKSDPDEKYKHFVPLLGTFEITQEIYDLFSLYFEIFSQGDEDYLFNVNTLARKSIINERDFIGKGVFNSRLHDFFDDIVASEYGYTVIGKGKKQFLEKKEIEYINYGDTRHFAFLNLILSGYNPYDIAQLGGHRSLTEQMSYYGGAKPYCNSYAYALATGIVSKLPQNIKFGESRMVEMREELLLDKKNARKLDHGYCLSDNFPFDCVSAKCENGVCEFFRHESVDGIEKDIEIVEHGIDKNMDFLKSIVYTEPKGSISRQETVSDTRKKIIQLSRLIKEKEGK